MEDRPKQGFDLVPPLFNGMNVALGWAAFITWSYISWSKSIDPHRLSTHDIPKKVQAVTRTNEIGAITVSGRLSHVPASVQLLHWVALPGVRSHLLLVFRH